MNEKLLRFGNAEMFAEKEMISQIFLGNGVAAELTWNVLPLGARSAIAKSVLKSARPSGFIPVDGCVDYAYVRWFCRCIAKRFGDVEADVPLSLYLCALQSIESREARKFEQILSDMERKGSFRESEAKEICSVISVMKEEHGGLYQALNTQIDKLLEKVDPRVVFSTFHLASFSLNSKFNDSYFRFFDIKAVDSASFKEFWMIPNIILGERTAVAFQNLFHCAEPFPDPSKLMDSDNFLTLLNFSICKRKTFFDLVMQPCRGFLVERKYENCERYTEPFPEIRPLVLLTEYEAMKADPTAFESGVSRFLPYCDLPIAKQILPRFGNDFELMTLLRTMSGSRLNWGDLVTKSIPQFLNNNLRTFDLEKLLDFRSKKMFLVCDRDRGIDFSFMIAYKALTEVIDKNAYSEELPTFDNLRDLLGMIANNDIKCDTVSDIFSLIFLRSNDGEYVYSPEIACRIVEIISGFDPDNKYLSKAKQILECAVDVGFQSLKEAFEPVRNQFLDLLKNRNYRMAKRLSETDEHLSKIAHVAEALDALARNEPMPSYTDVDKSLLTAECYLSLNKDLGFKSSEASELVNDRKMGPRDPLELFESSSLRNIIIRLERDITDPGLNISHYHMLKAFSDFERTQNRGQEGIRSVSDIIAELLSDPTTTWDQMETMLGKERAAEQIFQYGQKEKMAKTGEVYEALRARFPLPLVCLTKSATETYANNKAIQAAVADLIDIQTVNDIGNIEDYLKECDEKLLDISAERIETMTKVLAKQTPMRVDLLHLLYLRNPDVVDRIIQPLLPELKIEIIQGLDSFLSHKVLYDLKESNLTVEETLEALLKKRAYAQAKELASDMSLQKNLRTKMNKIIKEADDDTLCRIERVFSDYANQIRIRREELDDKNTASDKLNYCVKLKEAKSATYTEIVELLEEIRKNSDVVTSAMMTEMVGLVSGCLEQICVDSLDSEMDAMLKVSRLVNIIFHLKLKMKNASEVARFGTWFIQLQYLEKFVSCGVFGRFNTQYSLKAFSGKEAGRRFLKICRKRDYKYLMRDIQSAWQITYGVYDPAMMCFELGMLKHGLVELRIAANFVKIINSVDTKIDDTALVQILTRPIVVDLAVFEPEQSEAAIEISRTKSLTVIESCQMPLIVQRINEGSVPCPMIHEAVKRKLDEESEFGVIFGSPQISALLDSFDILEAFESKMVYLSRNGLFDDSFQLYQTHFMSQHNRTPVFLKALLSPALAYQNWNAFLRKLMRRISVFAPVILDVCKWLEQNGLHQCLFELQKGVNFFDHAIKSALILLEDATSWAQAISLLEDIKILISKSANAKNPEEHHSFLPQEELFSLQRCVSLQLSVWKMFQQNNEPFNKEFGLVGRREKALKLGAYLLSKLQVGVASEISLLPNIELEDMCDVLVDDLSQRDGQIPQFFGQLTRLEPSTYAKIVGAIMSSIHRRSASDQSFVAFVKGSVKGSENRARILARFGFIDDALAVARGNEKAIAAVKSIARNPK